MELINVTGWLVNHLRTPGIVTVFQVLTRKQRMGDPNKIETIQIGGCPGSSCSRGRE